MQKNVNYFNILKKIGKIIGQIRIHVELIGTDLNTGNSYVYFD